MIKIVIDDEEEKALSPEAEELLRRRAAEVGFSASGWSGRRVGLAPTGKAPPCHGARG